jgi:hypothetical protein
MNKADLDAVVARGEFIYAVFVPSAAFVREELFDLAEEGGFQGDGEEAFALIHCCLFRSDLVAELRRWGEIERFPTRRVAVAWCRGCNLRFVDTAWDGAAATMMHKTILLLRQICRPRGETPAGGKRH